MQEQWGVTDRHWSVEREREIGTVMALKARWNLVLRLLVDNGLREMTCRHHFFGNVGWISQMHQVTTDVVLSCSCECV